jgi:LAO/AO transport system kinase
MWQQYLDNIQHGDVKALARTISLIENEVPGYEELLQLLPPSNKPIIGITGPPGAGKSTLTDALIGHLVGENKKVGILCIDPSSPFNLGALLGDRIRMSDWYNHPNVFIRSLATRGSLGGLHPKIIEISDVLKASPVDYIIIETVGVGQSEIEIAGDEVQTMKAGLMEIADLFVVNKADRPDADLFVRNLKLMLAPAFHKKEIPIPVIKTIASQKQGIEALYGEILAHIKLHQLNDKRCWLLAEKSYFLIQQKRMTDINKEHLKMKIEAAGTDFNLYRFIQNY